MEFQEFQKKHHRFSLLIGLQYEYRNGTVGYSFLVKKGVRALLRIHNWLIVQPASTQLWGIVIQNLNQNAIAVDLLGLAVSSRKSVIRVLHVDDDPLILEMSKLMLIDLNGNFEIDHGRKINVSLSISSIKNEKGTITLWLLVPKQLLGKLLNTKKVVEYIVEPVEKYRKSSGFLAKEVFKSEQ